MSNEKLILCSDAVRMGMLAFEHGESSYCADGSINSPYEAPDGPLQEIGTHGGQEIGFVRVRIDYRKMWLIGWNLAEERDIKKRKAVVDGS